MRPGVSRVPTGAAFVCAGDLTVLPLTELVANEPHEEEQSANRHVKHRDHSHDDSQPESAAAHVPRIVHSLVLARFSARCYASRRGVGALTCASVRECHLRQSRQVASISVRGMGASEDARDVLRLYLAGRIDAAEAEIRSGIRFPDLQWRPIGKPALEADWQDLLDCGLSDEERERVSSIRAAIAEGRPGLSEDAARTLMAVFRRATGRCVS